MLRIIIELFGQELLLESHVLVHLEFRGRIGLDGVVVVHCPPVVVLEPATRTKVVHVDDPRADFTAFGVKGVDLDVKFTLLGGILGGVQLNARIFDLLGGLHWKYSTLQF